MSYEVSQWKEELRRSLRRPHRGGRRTEKAGEGPSVRAEGTTETEGDHRSHGRVAAARGTTPVYRHEG